MRWWAWRRGDSHSRPMVEREAHGLDPSPPSPASSTGVRGPVIGAAAVARRRPGSASRRAPRTARDGDAALAIGSVAANRRKQVKRASWREGCCRSRRQCFAPGPSTARRPAPRFTDGSRPAIGRSLPVSRLCGGARRTGASGPAPERPRRTNYRNPRTQSEESRLRAVRIQTCAHASTMASSGCRRVANAHHTHASKLLGG